MTAPDEVSLDDLRRCFSGVVPAVIATASADGTPNVTYLSRIHPVGEERVALSNQFFSKTSQNLVENPRASVLLIDPHTYDEYRLLLAYERTERRGGLFDRLRTEVDAIAAITGMQDVFRLRAADIYRVLEIERCPSNPDAPRPEVIDTAAPGTVAIGEMCTRISRCADLDALVSTVVDGLVEVLGYEHVHLLLVDEAGQHLYTMASRGFDAESVGAEVAVGDGVVGKAAEQGAPMRVGNLGQMAKYSRSIHQSWSEQEGGQPAPSIPMPGLPGAQSRVAVPALALGQLVGVLTADRAQSAAFGPEDEAALLVVASMFATAYETLRAEERAAEVAPVAAVPTTPPPAASAAPATRIRHYPADGSTFVDGDYLIKGVAGRILWTLLQQHLAEGRSEFTNKELRLDPSLQMPGFKDNLEARLILLRRRLEERGGPVRMLKAGRGRFRIEVDRQLVLDLVEGQA